MAWISRHLVERFDKDHAAQARRDNARRLIASLKRVPAVRPMCDELAPGVVPMCVPVLVRERARVQQALIARGIHPLHLWPRPAEVLRDHSPSIAEIQENILCLPVADCYGADEMERIVGALRETA